MFAIQVIVSFIVGGLFIAGQTLVAERINERWRGTILTLPSTLAMGLFFIGLINGVSAVPEAVLVIPTALGIDYLFVLSFAFFSRFNLATGFVGGYGIWAISAALLMHFLPSINLWSSIVLYSLPMTIVAYVLVRNISNTTVVLDSLPFRWKHLLIRSLLAGSVVSITVVLAKTMGNVWGGLFTTFPAAFSSMFLIYYFVYGKKVIPQVAASLFWPGAIIFLVYLLVAILVFPRYGIWIGTLLCYLSTLPVYGLYVLATHARVRKILWGA